MIPNRWETNADKDHAGAGDRRIRLICLTMQRDECMRRINERIWGLPHRLFGKISKAPVPAAVRIDPAVCSPEEKAFMEIEHLLRKQEWGRQFRGHKQFESGAPIAILESCNKRFDGASEEILHVARHGHGSTTRAGGRNGCGS